MSTEVITQQPIQTGGKSHGIHGISGRVGGFLKGRARKQSQELQAEVTPKEINGEQKADTPLYRRYATSAANAFRSKSKSREGSREGSAGPQPPLPTEASTPPGEEGKTEEAKAVVEAEKPSADDVKDVAVVDETKPDPQPEQAVEGDDKTPEAEATPVAAEPSSANSTTSSAVKLVRRISSRAGNVISLKINKQKAVAEATDGEEQSPTADASPASPPVSKASLLARQVSTRAGELFTKAKAGSSKEKESSTEKEGSDDKPAGSAPADAATNAPAEEKPEDTPAPRDQKDWVVVDEDKGKEKEGDATATEIEKPLPHPPPLAQRLSSRVEEILKPKSKAQTKAPDTSTPASTDEAAAEQPTASTRPKLTTRISNKVGAFIKASGDIRSPISPATPAKDEQPSKDKAPETEGAKSDEAEVPKAETEAEGAKADGKVEEDPKAVEETETTAKPDAEAKPEADVAPEVAPAPEQSETTGTAAPLAETPAETAKSDSGAGIGVGSFAKLGRHLSTRIGGLVKSRGGKVPAAEDKVADAETKEREEREEGEPPVLPPKAEDKAVEDEAKPEAAVEEEDGTTKRAEEKETKKEDSPKEASTKAVVEGSAEDTPVDKEEKPKEEATIEEGVAAAPVPSSNEPEKIIEASTSAPTHSTPPPPPPTAFQSSSTKARKLGRRLSARVGDLFKANLKNAKGDKEAGKPKEEGKEVEPPALPPKDETDGDDKVKEEDGKQEVGKVEEDVKAQAEEEKVEKKEEEVKEASAPEPVIDGTAAEAVEPEPSKPVEKKDEAPAETAPEATPTADSESKEAKAASETDSAPIAQDAQSPEGAEGATTTASPQARPSSFANPKEKAKKLGRRLSARVGDLFKREKEKEKVKVEGDKEEEEEAKRSEEEAAESSAKVVDTDTTKAGAEDASKAAAAEDSKEQVKQDDAATEQKPLQPPDASDSTEAVENIEHHEPEQQQPENAASTGTKPPTEDVTEKQTQKSKDGKPLPTKPSKSARAKEVALDAGRQLSIRATELLKPKPKLESTSSSSSGKAAVTKSKEGSSEGPAPPPAPTDNEAQSAADETPAAPQPEAAADSTTPAAKDASASHPPVSSSGTRSRKASDLGKRLSMRVSEAFNFGTSKGRAAEGPAPQTPPKDEKVQPQDGVKADDGAKQEEPEGETLDDAAKQLEDNTTADDQETKPVVSEKEAAPSDDLAGVEADKKAADAPSSNGETAISAAETKRKARLSLKLRAPKLPFSKKKGAAKGSETQAAPDVPPKEEDVPTGTPTADKELAEPTPEVPSKDESAKTVEDESVLDTTQAPVGSHLKESANQSATEAAADETQTNNVDQEKSDTNGLADEAEGSLKPSATDKDGVALPVPVPQKDDATVAAPV